MQVPFVKQNCPQLRLFLDTLIIIGHVPGCYLELVAGAGGNDSADWAGMLLRMYSAFAKHKGYRVIEMDHSPGPIAGVRNATLKIEG